MRHAGSLPQLTSPTSTSMLMKRTSSGGGKDHGLVSFMIFLHNRRLYAYFDIILTCLYFARHLGESQRT